MGAPIGNTNKRLKISGKRFGSWYVIEYAGISKGGASLWKCRCACGRVRVLRGETLTAGISTQCQSCSRSSNVKIRIRPFEALFNWVRKRSREEGHEFSITYEEFAALSEARECHYCFAPVFFAKHCVNKTGHKYNLDRKDNILGYLTANLVACCKRCNFAKGARYTYAEWFGMTEYFRKQKEQEQPNL